MSQNKNKDIDTSYFDFDRLVSQVGLAAMSLAAVVSLIEPDQFRHEKTLMVPQPAYATVNVSSDPIDQNRADELIRREKEGESAHELVSYGTTMRSHPTAGKR